MAAMPTLRRKARLVENEIPGWWSGTTLTLSQSLVTASKMPAKAIFSYILFSAQSSDGL